MRKRPEPEPVSLHASLRGLPQVQRRAWGAIALRPGLGAVLVLAPPNVPVTLAATEAVAGSYPVFNGREFPFTTAVLAASILSAVTAVTLCAATGAGNVVMCGFAAALLGALMAAIARRAGSRCRVIPLPQADCAVACAIEHASSVARACTGIPDYDRDVTDAVRSVLWETAAPGMSVFGPGQPLARILHAVLDRNRALIGPHASPSWYPAVTEDPARHPPAAERSVETAAILAAILRNEADMIRDGSSPGDEYRHL